MMTQDKILGWAFIVIGICLVCGGFYELLSGMYVPTGHRNGAFKRLFKLLFIEFGPAFHSLIWFAIGSACIGAGISTLKTSRKERNPEKFNGQKPLVRSKK